MRVLAVTNMYPTPDHPALGTFVEQQVVGLRRAGAEVHVLLADRGRDGISAYKGLSRRVAAEAAAFRPDLLHVMYGGVMAGSAVAALPGVPTVLSFCGSDLLGELLSGHLRRWIAGYGVWCSHRAARKAHGIVVKSTNLRDALPRGIDQSRVAIIPNGIDLQRFRPMDRRAACMRLGWDPATFNILFPTNAGDPRKRLPLAQAAIESMRAGGVAVELHQLKGVPHPEVPLWMNASDAVILTSLHEGSPNVVKEALACDVPVVSVDVGDVRERIGAIEGCYLADADPGDLADRLYRVWEGPRRVDGRRRMEELSLESVAARLMAFYRQVSSRETRQ
jgi:glycosyltransferase involved in cell wall biosynthesis